MQIGSIDANQLRGLGDKFIGLAKEFWGTVLDNERLQDEGEAQQARGTEHLKAFKEQLKAQKHEAKADAFSQQQKAAQRMKDSA